MPYFCKLKIIGDDILLEREDVSEIKCLSWNDQCFSEFQKNYNIWDLLAL
jgi:hypothetical protein